MEATELQEIKERWESKFPDILITLYPKSDNGKYCGKMLTQNECFNLNADTIAELISQGESFLRKV
jgi:hypothetical protein